MTPVAARTRSKRPPWSSRARPGRRSRVHSHVRLPSRCHRRTVKPADLGWPEPVPLDLALTWEPTTRAAVGTVAELWRVDMERRSLLLGSAWIASAFATPTREWLLHWLEDDTAHVGNRRVGAAEVDAVWSICHTFDVADKRLGGGYARTTLVHYVNQVVLPLLEGTYSERVGRSLLAATARLCDLAGWTAYDPDAQGLGQRHYIQALRLAQASGDRAIGALILSDMAQQAHHLGNPAEACSLARSGQRAAEESGSPDPRPVLRDGGRRSRPARRRAAMRPRHDPGRAGLRANTGPTTSRPGSSPSPWPPCSGSSPPPPLTWAAPARSRPSPPRCSPAPLRGSAAGC
jgi:hypothetical protein